MDFTPAQDTAIHARNRELLVSAAAGSGKTRVLIERIYAMLTEDGFSLDRLLVVTFTRAAAAEMRERLQTRLTEAAVNNPRMRRQSELLETAQISTLHSFCQKLVRAYFQEVDMDPLATLGDETVCANLRAQAMNDAMDALYERATEDADAASLTVKFEDSTIARILDALLRFLTSLPDPFAWLGEYAQKTYSEKDLREGPMAETLFADCQTLLSGAQELSAANDALAELPLCPEAYRKAIRGDGQAVRALAEASPGGLPAMMAAASAFALDRMPSLRNLEGDEALLRDRYKQNRELLKKRVAAIRDTLPQDPAEAIRKCNAMQPALRALCALAQDADARYAAFKRDRALLDFTDLERMTLTLLKNADIRAEVADRFDGIFVDEYQDISGVQEAILQALKRDVSRETAGLPQRIFYVGDVKQSIYRFRQADPTLFMEKMRTFRIEENATERRVTLNANFRSRETVLASVNRVFERVMRADVTEIAYDAEARLYPGSPSAGDPPTTVHLFTQAAKPADRVRLQALAIAREIRRRVGEPVLDRDGNPSGVLHFRDFAVLGAKMKGVADVLERTLTEMGIPVYSEDRGGGMQSAEIAQALNHLKLMDQLADDLALLSELRSPAMGFDDRELGAIRLKHPQGSFLEALRFAAQGEDLLAARCDDALAAFAHERFLLMESRLDEYLWGWLNRSGMYAFYGCQPNGKLRQANLRMLCDRAGEHVKHRGGDLRDFLSSVQADTAVHDSKSPTVLSPWEDVVRVMTIHKSKGLEFPVVFVMGLEDSFTRRSDSRAAMHPRLGVALPYVNEETRTTDDTLLRAAIDLRARMEERAEKARLLYVAMTRAREELILLGWKDDITPEAAADGFAQNSVPSAYAVASAKNMIGWVCDCLNANDTVAVLTDDPKTNIIPWKTDSETGLSTQSTINPQKRAGWRVVFHTGLQELTEAARLAKGTKGITELEIRRARLHALLEDARALAASEGLLPTSATEVPTAAPARATGGGSGASGLPGASFAATDPLLPPLQFSHRPFKVGVTALVRAERAAATDVQPIRPEEDADDAAVETVDQKRLPLPLTRPKLMSDLPTMPAFMRPPAEQTGVRRGVATHKTLSLLQWDELRAAEAADALPADIVRQVAALAERRQLTPEEAALVQPERIAAFFQSPIGRQALAAETVRREWSFNLRLAERGGLIAQGVIDLCFLRDGQWSLVDYKTDRVADASELWDSYGEQMALYRRALAEAGGAPVRDTTLFSLALGAGSTR